MVGFKYGSVAGENLNQKMQCLNGMALSEPFSSPRRSVSSSGSRRPARSPSSPLASWSRASPPATIRSSFVGAAPPQRPVGRRRVPTCSALSQPCWRPTRRSRQVPARHGATMWSCKCLEQSRRTLRGAPRIVRAGLGTRGPMPSASGDPDASVLGGRRSWAPKCRDTCHMGMRLCMYMLASSHIGGRMGESTCMACRPPHVRTMHCDAYGVCRFVDLGATHKHTIVDLPHKHTIVYFSSGYTARGLPARLRHSYIYR